MKLLAIAIILLHIPVLLAHDAAHRSLGVALVPWQTVFVYSVIVVGPLAAGVLLRLGRMRTGYLLLAVTMLGSLLFGGYHHYVGISPDHVDHLPPGTAQGLFRTTAFAMLVVEAAGVAIGVLGLRELRATRRPSA